MQCNSVPQLSEGYPLETSALHGQHFVPSDVIVPCLFGTTYSLPNGGIGWRMAFASGIPIPFSIEHRT